MLGGLDYRTIATAVRRALNPILGSNVGTDGSVLTLDSTKSAGARWSLPGTSSSIGRNIAARTNAGTPNTKFDMSADSLVVKDANGGALHLSAVAVTVDMSVVGANGMDVVGGQAASTWYYGWVIAKPDGTTAGLASTSATAPALPAGYTFKALVTAVRSDGSTHFIKYRQTGKWARYESGQTFFSNGSATAETSVSLSSIVPPVAEEWAAFFTVRTAFSVVAVSDDTFSLRVVSGSDYINGLIFATSTGEPHPSVSEATFPYTGNFYYLWTRGSTGGTGPTFYSNQYVTGFSLPCGGQ